MNKTEEKEIRCGACGYFPHLSADELNKLSQDEVDNAELVLCEDCQNQSLLEQENRYITKDMAIDAEDLSLEGQRY